MKRIIVTMLCGLFLLPDSGFSQTRKCGMEIMNDYFMATHPDAAGRRQQRMDYFNAREEAVKNNTAKNAQQKTTATVTIPIVFHVILSALQKNQLGGDSGIKARMISQIEALNKDYNRQNADSTLIPVAFKPFYGNAEIQFAPAHRKPDGTGTDGVEIHITTLPGFPLSGGTAGSGYGCSQAKYNAGGGVDAWDNTKYLNVWVVNISTANILGVCFSPGTINLYQLPTVETGAVINYGTFGKRTSISQFFFPGSIDKGRTLTHELGHFFELDHIWGDNGSCPGSGGLDDGINDTPPQAKETFTSENPLFPKFDACASSGNGIMFMNFMDYVDDKDMQMFSQGQVIRMKAQVAPGGLSYSLTQHPEVLDWPTSVTTIEKNAGLNIYPNPSSGLFQLSYNSAEMLQSIQVFNMLGQQVYAISTDNTNTGNYNINLSGMSKGVYLIRCNFEAGTIIKKISLQ